MKNILSEVDIDICISFCLALVSNMTNCPRKIFSLSVNNRNELLMYFYGLLWKLGDIKHTHIVILRLRAGADPSRIINITLILITSGVTATQSYTEYLHSNNCVANPLSGQVVWRV